MIRIYYDLFNDFLDRYLAILLSLHIMYNTQNTFPKRFRGRVCMFTTAVVRFLEKIIEIIHIPTSHYDSTILSALSLQINMRALFNLGFNLAILIFTTLTAFQFSLFPYNFVILIKDIDYCILVSI